MSFAETLVNKTELKEGCDFTPIINELYEASQKYNITDMVVGTEPAVEFFDELQHQLKYPEDLCNECK